MDSVKRIGLLLLLCLFIHCPDSTGIEPPALQQSETRVKKLFAQITSAGSYEEKSKFTDSIADILYNTLQLPGSFSYPFDQLTALGKITSRDQKIRIYTWNLPSSDGTNKFYGFLQCKTRDDKTIKVYRLKDNRSQISNPAMVSLTTDNWYGCLIYEIIDKKQSSSVTYTLLGYSPENFFISSKIIDFLWFNEKDEPVFGNPVFQVQKQIQYRILFEYSARVTMSLQWNDKMNMIVFDHLSPSKPSYSGNYQYYGPDLSFDGLRFEKGIWVMSEDLDVRNSNE